MSTQTLQLSFTQFFIALRIQRNGVADYRRSSQAQQDKSFPFLLTTPYSLPPQIQHSINHLRTLLGHGFQFFAIAGFWGWNRIANADGDGNRTG